MKTKTLVKLWRLVFDVEKTEEWLNRLAAEGLNCVGFGCIAYRYYFEQGEPGEYTYRVINLEESFGHPKSIRYMAFLKENGVEYVGHAFRNVFLRKRAAEGEFNLFTDRESQIRHCKSMLSEKIVGTFALSAAVALFIYTLIIGSINMAAGIGHISSHFHPIMIALYAAGLLNIACLISYVRQWIRYASRIKKLENDSTVYE